MNTLSIIIYTAKVIFLYLLFLSPLPRQYFCLEVLLVPFLSFILFDISSCKTPKACCFFWYYYSSLPLNLSQQDIVLRCSEIHDTVDSISNDISLMNYTYHIFLHCPHSRPHLISNQSAFSVRFHLTAC